jgi:hypothetical protein
VEGRTKRQIAEVVGVAPSTVHADLLAALREWIPTATEQEWQALVLERLERTMAPRWALAIEPEAVVVTLGLDGAGQLREDDRSTDAGLVTAIQSHSERRAENDVNCLRYMVGRAGRRWHGGDGLGAAQFNGVPPHCPYPPSVCPDHTHRADVLVQLGGPRVGDVCQDRPSLLGRFALA